MSKVDVNNIMDEVVVYLRNKITDPKVPIRGATQTDEFNGNGNLTTFTLTKAKVRNVETVTVDASAKTFGTDYTVNYQPGVATVVTFTSAPGAGTNNVDITYDYGATWIYPDMPMQVIGIEQFPRMSVVVVGGATDVIGLNKDGFMTSLMLDIISFSETDDTTRDLLRQAKDNLMDDAKSFYYFDFIKPVAIGALLDYPNAHTKIVQQNLTAEIPYIFES